MKPWMINILLIAFYLAFANIVNSAIAFIFYFLPILILSSIFVYIDSSRLHIDKYEKKSFLSGDSVGYAVAVFFFWYIALPAYISFRRKIIDGEIPLKEMPKEEVELKKMSKKSLVPFFLITLAITTAVIYLALYSV